MADNPVVKYPKWHPELMAALAETDPNGRLERVKEAEKAISKRFGKILRSTSHTAEIEAIVRALDALEILKRKASQPKAS